VRGAQNLDKLLNGSRLLAAGMPRQREKCCSIFYELFLPPKENTSLLSQFFVLFVDFQIVHHFYEDSIKTLTEIINTF
jgi:hypothetical protein